MTAPSDADKPASGPAGAKPDASRPLPGGPGTAGKPSVSGGSPAGAASPTPKVSGQGDAAKPGMGGEAKAESKSENKTDAKPLTTASGTTAGPTGAGTKPAPLAAMGADAKAGPTDTPSKTVVPPVSSSGAAKTEPLKTESSPGGKGEPAKPAAATAGGTPKVEPTKADAAKSDTAKSDPVNTAGPSARPGGPAGPVTGAAVTAGPILDLKATRVPDPSAAGPKDASKDSAKDATKDTGRNAAGVPLSGQAKPSGTGSSTKAETPPAGARGSSAASPSTPSSAASPSAAAAALSAGAGSAQAKSASPGATSVTSTGAKSGAGFGSIAAAGLIGGVIGAGLLFAVEKAGIGGDTGQVSALDQKLSSQIAALDQRVGTLAPKDALSALDKRVAAAEASAKQANEKAASAASSQGSGSGAVPADLASRLDSLDQRVSALQEEPGRDASGNAGMGVAQIESARQVADLDARVKALEGGGNANGGSADTAKALSSLKGEVEARTKQNADAVAALGQRVDGLQQSLGEQVKSATESVQAATEATRKATEANQAQAAEASKAVDRKLAEQASQIATLDKGLADRAPASTVQAALRVVVADRIASALASGTPYAEPLATLTKLDPQAQGQASALKPFADKGAPTVGQLAETFRGISQSIAQSRRAAQTKAASESGDFRTKLLSMADGLVQVRKVDGNSPAEGPAAAPEEKVQAALDRGDLDAASAAFDAMPPEAKTQAGDFGATLAARAKAAQASRTLTASAFSALPAPASK